MKELECSKNTNQLIHKGFSSRFVVPYYTYLNEYLNKL